MAEYGSLLSDLSENITSEDLRQLKSACKEDIPEGESDHIACSRDWFTYLEERSKLAQDNLSYIEHIFEISRRPDVAPCSASRRAIPPVRIADVQDIIRQPSEDEIIKLAPPPKKA
ncbi:unnamed protein product [Gadus morhua 'NCC']